VTIDEQIIRTAQGWWVLKDDTHLSRWVEQAQRLDHDQPVLMGVLYPYIRVGSTVIDAGAAIGDHTHFYLNCVGRGGTVYAFEPHPIQYECLIRNCPRALNYRYALGEEPGAVWLFHQPDIVAGSRLIDPALQWPMSAAERVLLDDIVVDKTNVSLLKIDVEGCEPEVIRGARAIIKASRPAIWMEVNPEALERQNHTTEELRLLLEEINYRVIRAYPDGADWQGYGGHQCDMLCVPT
jgi:FkbM family methyltransferase